MLALTYPISPYDCKCKPSFTKLQSNISYMLYWFGAVVKNPNNPENPLVQVLFRPITSRTSTKIELGSFIKEELPVSLISHLLIGSIWINGESKEIVVFPEITTTVSFEPTKWQICSFRTDTPFPIETYPLLYGKKDYSKMLELSTATGEKLIVNCMEFYRAVYGYSAELKRVLMTYPYQNQGSQNDSVQSILVPGGIVSKTNVQQWEVIQPSHKYVKADAPLLAHLKYDLYTQSTIKKMTNNRIQGWLGSKSLKFPFAFIDVEPWHCDSNVKIIVQGIETPTAFLVLRIIGVSDPHGQEILLHTPLSKRNSGRRGASSTSAYSIQRQTHSVPVSSTFSSNWDEDNAVLPIKTQVIGNKRKIASLSAQQAAHGNSGGIGGANTKTFSTAPQKGTGKGVGGILSQESSRFEKMWCEAKELQQQGSLSAVEWYDGKVFHTQSPIGSIELATNSSQKSRVAQAFVMKLSKPDGRAFVCVELAGRNDREIFTGMIAEIEVNPSVHMWIKWMLHEVIMNAGVFRKFAKKSIYKNFKVYKHGRDGHSTLARVLRELK